MIKQFYFKQFNLHKWAKLNGPNYCYESLTIQLDISDLLAHD